VIQNLIAQTSLSRLAARGIVEADQSQAAGLHIRE